MRGQQQHAGLSLPAGTTPFGQPVAEPGQGDFRILCFFGEGGDDFIWGDEGSETLNGGEGNDALKGGSGNDALYGAEGNDVLYASAGYDQLYGGVGDDVFRLGASANNTHIMDFNQANGDHDRLLFAHTVFGSTAALGAAAHQVVNDVVIAQGNFHLTVHDALLQEVLHSSAIIVG